jgi:hypothetical protein
MNSTRAFRFMNNHDIGSSNHFASLLSSVSLSILFRVLEPQVQEQASNPISKFIASLFYISVDNQKLDKGLPVEG